MHKLLAIVILPQDHAPSAYEIAEPHPMIFECVAVDHHNVLEVVGLVHVDDVPRRVHDGVQLIGDGFGLVGGRGFEGFLDQLDDLGELGASEVAVGLVLERVSGQQQAGEDGDQDVEHNVVPS